MPEQPNFPQSKLPRMSQHRPHGYVESDIEYVERQFSMSIAALERVHALAPGEFETLIRRTTLTDDERQRRIEQHHEIARKAFLAAQLGLITEEDFNIWSGRRKENGQPVKAHFEQAYINASTPLISCTRGALTGIVRAFARIQDEAIEALVTRGETVQTAAELLAIEEEANAAGFIDFELYPHGDIQGWPSYPRSSGRFRGASRLRRFLEQRQTELTLSAADAEKLRVKIILALQQSASAKQQKLHPDGQQPSFIHRLLAKIIRLFHPW